MQISKESHLWVKQKLIYSFLVKNVHYKLILIEIIIEFLTHLNKLINIELTKNLFLFTLFELIISHVLPHVNKIEHTLIQNVYK